MILFLESYQVLYVLSSPKKNQNHNNLVCLEAMRKRSSSVHEVDIEKMRRRQEAGKGVGGEWSGQSGMVLAVRGEGEVAAAELMTVDQLPDGSDRRGRCMAVHACSECTLALVMSASSRRETVMIEGVSVVAISHNFRPCTSITTHSHTTSSCSGHHV